MSIEIKPFWLVYITLVILSVENFVAGKPIVPCHFIFGDSLADGGNNNALETLAKTNYEPYGVDFPKGPTGRFTNGRTVADIIVKRLGFKDYIPPFRTAKGSKILEGVNYASGSAGILDETGKNQGTCISLSKQVANHKTTVSHIVDIVGSKKKAKQHLQKCLYSFTIGSNDYINNYFMPQFYNTSQLYTTQKYAKFLVKQYENQIRTLYQQGARKMYLVGLGSIGCTPNATAVYGADKSLCVSKMNNAAVFFNNLLKSLVNRLNKEYKDAKFVYIETTSMASEYASPLTILDLKLAPCCEVGETGLCIPGKRPCQERDKYLFWDSFHATESVNEVQANKIFSSSDPSELFPMNIQQLAKLTITKKRKYYLKRTTN